ncbi:MAG: aspartate/glutamate racemase family protein [Gemmatimonadota bacterium]|nr:MAG: aspartate/glutamate racemase family protein [Gemmatimonadota bacterium]
MNVIGLLGGMSWESTVEYYRIINQEVRRRLGGQHSARILMYSVDFEEIDRLQIDDEWDRAGQLLGTAAKRLERGGADFILMCTNTMHKVASAVQDAVRIPLIHIADALAERIKAQKLTRVGLLGTRFTMEEDFYKGRLSTLHGLEVFVPGTADREIVDRVIYGELCQGQMLAESRREYVRIIEALAGQGADGVILGCTEIGLLIKPDDSPLPVFDTARIHAEAGVDRAIDS